MARYWAIKKVRAEEVCFTFLIFLWLLVDIVQLTGPQEIAHPHFPRSYDLVAHRNVHEHTKLRTRKVCSRGTGDRSNAAIKEMWCRQFT